MGFAGYTCSRFAPGSDEHQNMSINQIACGSDHSIAVSRRHSCIHVWGRNVEGQLGLGDVKDRSTPVRVTFAWWPLPPPGRDLDSVAKSPVDGEEEDWGDEDDEGGTVVASCGTTHSLLSRPGKRARRGSPPLDLVIPSAHFTKGRLLWRVGQQSLCIIPTVREHQNIKLSASFSPPRPLQIDKSLWAPINRKPLLSMPPMQFRPP